MTDCLCIYVPVDEWPGLDVGQGSQAKPRGAGNQDLNYCKFNFLMTTIRWFVGLPVSQSVGWLVGRMVLLSLFPKRGSSPIFIKGHGDQNGV